MHPSTWLSSIWSITFRFSFTQILLVLKNNANSLFGFNEISNNGREKSHRLCSIIQKVWIEKNRMSRIQQNANSELPFKTTWCIREHSLFNYLFPRPLTLIHCILDAQVVLILIWFPYSEFSDSKFAWFFVSLLQNSSMRNHTNVFRCRQVIVWQRKWELSSST